jgi:tetratricopeptide (TPR) repeat protein
MLLAAALLAPAIANAQDDDDWSITRHPGGRHPHGTTRHPASGATGRPRPPHTGSGTAVTANTNGTAPSANTDPARARRDRMIAALTNSVVRGASDDTAALGVLMRLVRERDGSIDALVTEFERRAREAPNDLGAHLALGHLYRETGRFEDALREYGVGERIAPQSPAPARAAAALYRRMDRNADARTAFERALAHTTERNAQIDTLRQLIDLSLSSNNVAAARTYHQRLVSLDRTSSTMRRELADALLQRRLYRDAIAEYQSLARAMAGDNRVLPPVLRDLGRAYVGNNQFDEALETYRRALALAGSDAGIRRELYDAMTEVYTARNALPAWIAELERMGGGRDGYERAVLLGRLHDQAGETSAAIAAYRRAVAARPNDVDAHVRIAQLFHQQGMRNEEIAEYRRLVALAPREPRFVIELADLLVGQGQQEEAFRMLAQASARAGSDPNVHERLAEVYARHGRQQEALHEIELVARFDPSSPVGLIALGRQYMELGQRERALGTWRRILDTARDRARGAVTLAEVYADNAMLNEAVEMYRLAIGLRPNEVDFHRGLASVLERARHFDEAIAEWRRVLELAPATDRDVRRLARESVVRLWSMQGQLPQQIARLQTAFDRTPPDIDAGRDLGEALVRARRGDEAIRVLRRVIQLDPTDVTSMVTLERTLTNTGDLAGSIEILQRLVEADSRRAREWYQRMAQHALALHRDEQAIEYATRAVQLNDQDATAHLRLAELYRARSDMSHAIAALRRALELNDRLYPSYFELADLYLGYENRPAEAISLYRRVITLAPDDDYVNRAGRLAIQIAPAAGLGDDVERDLAAASAASPTRPVFRRLLVAYYDAAARPWINRLQQGTPADAARARSELSRMGARALAPLLDALGDSDPAQQRIALDILGYLGNPNATSALVAVAENDRTEAEIRRRALAAAGALGDARALPRLLALQSPAQPDGVLAVLATWAIAHIHTPAATNALVRSLEPARPDDLRVMAALGLAGTRDPHARLVLRDTLRSQAQSSLRAAAAYALGGHIERSEVPTLVAALATGTATLRAAACLALGASGDPQGASRAIARTLFAADEAGRNGSAASLRRAAARALVRLAGGTVAASDSRTFDDPTLARSGSGMLAALLDPPVTNFDGAAALTRFQADLTAAALDALRGLPEHVLVALQAFAEPDSLRPLIETVPSGDAHRALESIRTAIAPAAAEHVTHPDAAIRRAALRVVESSESPEAIHALARAVSDSDEGIAIRAIAALGRRVGDPAAYEAIATRLDPSVSWSVRAAAASALGASRDARAIARLVALLADDEFEYVRAEAARALDAHRDDPMVSEALARATERDPAASVRDAARGRSP